MSKRVVIALGGNAIQEGSATAQAQQETLEKTVEQIMKFIENDIEVIIAHGNGPQIGNLLIQQKAADSEKTPALPLDTCGAMSQGMIGYWICNALTKKLKEHNIDKQAATVITRVEVDKNDKGFANPTKPIGPFYTKEEADVIAEDGSVFVEDSGRGWRKVVASPAPINIVEYPMIETLVDKGFITVSCGGGGIPVVKTEAGYEGVDAVIDKDLASAKLAELVKADTLLILTAVDNVAINFNKPNQEILHETTLAELEKHKADGQFAPGSMLPKIDAAMTFVRNTDRPTIITSLEKAFDAFNGKAGTIVK